MKPTVRFGLSSLNPSVGIIDDKLRRTDMFEEISDVLSQTFQVKALHERIIRIDGRTDKVTLAPEDKIRAFIQSTITANPAYYQQARTYIDTLAKKCASRSPWRTYDLTPLQHYATRAGDELRELMEVIHQTKLEPRKSIPVVYAQNFPLLRVAQRELLSARFDSLTPPDKAEDIVKKQLAHYVTSHNRLTQGYIKELNLVTQFVLQTGLTRLGPNYGTIEPYIELMNVKIQSRMEHGRDKSKKELEQGLMYRMANPEG